MSDHQKHLWTELSINLVIGYGWQWETEEYCSEDCHPTPNDALADFEKFLAQQKEGQDG